jgi:ABC-type multidrug transport system fused ATPase/permease subunit
LRNNIALDWRNKSINEDKFRYAIQIAQLDAINARMSPDNSGSLERLDLSGGEKQRVGIARAVYRTPDLLLLDEATSSLDADTEHAITEAIGQIQKDCTVVTIAHRLSSIKNADLVIYLDQGIIVATGTYEELILQVPDFARQVKISDSSAGS